jgi:hypothetical protein
MMRSRAFEDARAVLLESINLPGLISDDLPLS